MDFCKDKIACALGSTLEWYDFSLYGFYAPVIAILFFPSDVATISYIKTLGIFAIGFFARPMGALIFGYVSDKYGRAACLKITPLFITLPTIGMALLPTYSQIGMLAPILLIIIRIIQGLCVGGEFTNNIIYLYESTSLKKRYFFSSIGSCTGSLGIFFASLISSISFGYFSNNFLLFYGWRIAFSIAGLMGLVIYILRRNMSDTNIYKKLSKDTRTSRNPVIESFANQFFDYIKAIGLALFPATFFYFTFIFIPNYLSIFYNLETGKILEDNTLTLLARLLIIPIIGILADRFGGIKIARMSCLLLLVVGAPFFYWFVLYPQKIIFVILLFAFISTLNAATTSALIISLLKPQTRSTIFSFTFNFSFGVFGGIVPMLGLMIVHATGSKIAPIFYLMFTAIITFITTYYINQEKIYE